MAERNIGQKDYDYMGYMLKYGAAPDEGHLTDEFKTPTHMTFSDDSIYHNEKTPGGKWIQQDGQWHFYASPFNISQHPPEEMIQYFRENDPTSILHLPGTYNPDMFMRRTK